MTLAAYSHAAAGLAYGALAISLARRRATNPGRGSAAGRAFAAAVVLSAAWGISAVAAPWTGNAALALTSGLLDLGRYAAWFAFLLLLLRVGAGEVGGRRPWLLGVTALVALALLALVIAGLSPAAAAGVLAGIRPFASVALPVIGLVLVEQVFRSASNDAQWHAKPLCLGLAVLFVYDLYLHSHILLFGRLDEDSATIRGAEHALAAALLYVALQRRSDWSRAFHVSRDAVFHTASLVLAGGYLLLISAIAYYVRQLGGDWGGALQLILVCAALVLLSALALSGTMRAKLRVFISKHFFRYRYDYRSEWLRFTARLTEQHSPQEVGSLVVQGLAELLHSPAGALWYRDPDRAVMVQAARWNSPPSDRTEPEDSAFARFMLEREWVVDLPSCRADPRRHEGPQPPDWLLSDLRYWLVVPLIVGTRLCGFVVIERPHALTALNWEVRDLLKTASRQAAGFLALIHATEALLEARKFDAFNRMSAFVVHDLKNIVAQLSLMMQNAARLKANPEFQQDMLITVENSLERMRRLMLQLRGGQEPAAISAGVALPAVIERVRAAAAASGRSLQVQIVDRLVARGQEDRIERVVGHLVDNAFDAGGAAGIVTLSLSREGSEAQLAVRDAGHGMSPEFVSSRLFKPFNSTKTQGMGIGLYESRQYIQEVGGNITVDSEVGRGTIVTVRLPLLDVGPSAVRELYSVR